MRTADVKAILRERFCAPEWALMFEVGDATGTNQRRWADAVAMNMWPSRGLEIHGFEIKVSRGDWIRELKDPAKSESIQRYCNRWWIVAPEGLVRHEELPPTWGLYEAKGGKLKQTVAAPELEAVDVTRSFVAAMLRRASEADQSLVDAAVEARVTELRERDKARLDELIEARTRDKANALEQIQTIERISGIEISRWAGCEDIGRAVKLVYESGLVESYSRVKTARDSLLSALEEINKAFEAVPPANDNDKAIKRRTNAIKRKK